MSIAEQIEEQKRRLSQKWPGTMYIAYFQAFTNTYAPVEVLRQRYSQAISQPGIIGLAIATRPDCIDKKIAELLKEFSRKTYVMVELGLQTSNENTAEFINRGYPNSVFENAVKLLSGFGIDTVCHIIIGLPGESHEDMLNSVRYACSLGINGIKLQMLNVLEGTDLGEYYKIHPFDILSLDQYTDIVARLLEYIPEDIVIHRLTGDGPRDLVIEPKWVFDKRLVLNTISKKIRLYNIVQGRLSKQP